MCPERDGQLAYEFLRRERVVALLPEDHALAARIEIDLRELNDETFLMFPRELAPRLHDAMHELCRSSGFEPAVSRRAFHSAGDTGTIACGSVAWHLRRSPCAEASLARRPYSWPAMTWGSTRIWCGSRRRCRLRLTAFKELALSAFGYLTSK